MSRQRTTSMREPIAQKRSGILMLSAESWRCTLFRSQQLAGSAKR